ncbi:MAG: hypothetical protein JST83_08475 [Bacteroidetes bacterium]|nr:hypothetical protein [Bacteroidota bacterium]
MKILYYSLFIVSAFLSIHVYAQPQITNGGFEAWSGIDTARPDGWATTERLLGLPANKWVTQEIRPAYVHGGVSAVRLVADTLHGRAWADSEAYGTFIHTTGMATDGRTGEHATGNDGYTYMPGVIAAGTASQPRGYWVGSGVALGARPSTLSFWVRLSHPVPDTASVRVLLTRWSTNRGTRDTVAIDRQDIWPDSTVMTGYALFTDTLEYLNLEVPDTARITIYGGRTRNVAARGNETWIDGVVWGYGFPPPVRPVVQADSLWFMPNVVETVMKVRADSTLLGCRIIIEAETSVLVKDIPISGPLLTVDMTDVPVGNYAYVLIDTNGNRLRKGYLSVLRN